MSERAGAGRRRRLGTMTPGVLAPTMVLLVAGMVWPAPGVEAAGEETSRAVLAPQEEPGTRLFIAGKVTLEDGRPVPGARLHLYQTDATGAYTRDKPMDEPHARLAGRVTADAEGRFMIETIRPGGYPKAIHLGDRDRKIPAHIHIDVTAPGHPERRFQMVFADDPLLADPSWKDWVRRLDQPVLTVRGTERGAEGELTLILRPSQR